MRNIIILIFLIISVLGFGQQVKQNTLPKYNVNSKNVVLDGYDPVTYFTKNKAEKGSNKYQVNYDGVNFYFVSLENKKIFENNPLKFLPQYGGWCAFAMGDSGEKIEVDPKTFKIKDGKLYLFYNKYLTNTLKSWNKDEVNLKLKADRNWKRFDK